MQVVEEESVYLSWKLKKNVEKKNMLGDAFQINEP